jgi:hypothetical protein
MADLRNSPTKKKRRVKRQNLQTNRFAQKPKPDGNYRRAKYFKTYRPFRTALSICENSYIRKNNYKEYRANKYMYYFVLPLIAKYLRCWQPDWVRLYYLEIYLYGQLLSYALAHGHAEAPYRDSTWKYRYTRLRISV